MRLLGKRTPDVVLLSSMVTRHEVISFKVPVVGFKEKMVVQE